MNHVITHRDPVEGKVGIGKLPTEMYSTLDEISNAYIHLIPDKSSTTYHTYYTELTDKLKANFDKIQLDRLWDDICDGSWKCIRQVVPEMNEIYYSNPKPNFEKGNLYGAAANLIPHRDCILFYFPGIYFYRVIIGLTDSNEDTSTEFLNLRLEHKINRGDFMLFDFDRTLHQVKKWGQQETPRMLMKLHFIVCENCMFSENYVRFVSEFYKSYYSIARYTEQLGTDPKTFLGFFFGLLWEWPFYREFGYITGGLFFANIYLLHSVYKIQFKWGNLGKFAFYSVSNLFCIYLLLVSLHYGRYLLSNSFVAEFP